MDKVKAYNDKLEHLQKLQNRWWKKKQNAEAGSAQRRTAVREVRRLKRAIMDHVNGGLE